MNKLQKQFRKTKKNVRRYLKDHYYYSLNEMKVNVDKVLFESFDGVNQTCNPYAIYRFLSESNLYQNLSFIWVYNGTKPTDIDFDNSRVSFVEHGSLKYFYHLSTAGYLISNSTFPHQFTKKQNQIYLNTWHGVPLKKMGYDIPAGIPQTRNVIRNLLAADFILSSGPWMTETIWKRAFRLEGIYDGHFLEAGSPRTDQQVRTLPEERLLILEELGIDRADFGKKVVLYAPTWTGGSPFAVENNVDVLDKQRRSLQELLPDNEYLVLSKLHQFSLAKQVDGKSNAHVDPSYSTNRLLSVVDHLVTDQSSLLFDYLIEDRPIHFFVAPGTSQDITRGIYCERSDLPGSNNETVEEVVRAILAEDDESIARSGLSNMYRERRKQWRNTFTPYDDGQATSRVIQAVFGTSDRNKSNVKAECSRKTHPSIVIHVGSLIPNGITTAAKAIVTELIDLGYDVSVFYPYSNDSAKIDQALSFDSRARHIPRVGNIAVPINRRRAYRRFLSEGGLNARNINKNAIRRIFHREWARCFGNTNFDYSIAFDGYSVFWAELLLAGESKNRFIWLHNDLKRDADRTISGKKPHHANLTSLFSLYSSFDKIVSVSNDLNIINRKKLGNYASELKFESVRNFISHDFVKEQSQQPLEVTLPEGSPRFVTVGRLSPEKNQARMIRAMKLVVQVNPMAQLYIVGDGPLRAELRSLIRALDLMKNVHLLGYHTNPHVIVDKCDYFAFSSLYEGQGLAVIEAMVLGKPIVSTRYNVVDSVIADGDGYVTDATDEALASGMIKLMVNGHPNPAFDPVLHNISATGELRQLMQSSNKKSHSLEL